MALSNQGKVQNVKASLEKYIADNLSTTEGLTIAYEGFPFESSGVTEWVQENILKGGRSFHRQVDTTNIGQTTEVMINFNLFVDPSKTAKTNRHYELRDIVAGYFSIGKTISLYDFYNGEFVTSLQSMKVRDVVTDTAIPNDNYLQYNYTISIDWLEKWT